MKAGYIYIISNPSHKGFYKIGVTKNLKSRLHVYQTSDPKRSYKIEFSVLHPDCYAAEKRIKEMIKHFALSQRNEWVECDLQTAIVRLQEQVECEP